MMGRAHMKTHKAGKATREEEVEVAGMDVAMDIKVGVAVDVATKDVMGAVNHGPNPSLLDGIKLMSLPTCLMTNISRCTTSKKAINHNARLDLQKQDSMGPTVGNTTNHPPTNIYHYTPHSQHLQWDHATTAATAASTNTSRWSRQPTKLPI
jgi:hypothetical protein